MTNANRKCLRKGRLMVVLDRSKVIPDDPGADTPAMVHCFQFCATYWCACGEGELASSGSGMLQLTDKELQWLHGLDEEVTSFLYKETANA